ncbi:uncharacterized protein [Mytilus edulis]|uniref:uncharacterized protein n=1 Tax=Mytilus edulis TaxID=6550 RepID=UPI0039EEDA0E
MAIDSIPFNRNCIAARVALAVYLSGFLCFLIGLATPNWLHVDQGMQGGLWSACYYVQDVGWTCNQYKLQPEFIPAVQALAIITLLFYIVEFVVMVTVIILVLRNVGFGDYWNPKNISLVSSLVTFSAGCFSMMTLIVVAVKGKDYVADLQKDHYGILTYQQLGIDLTGSYSIGWSFGVTILSAIITFISFSLFIFEYKLLQAQIALPTEDS